jgi:carbamoyl-phosphate synthase small subunit
MGGDARLILADGTIHSGRSFGAPGTAGGEVVFNTSLTGYQEIITDPSYRGQIVCLTNPLIGNTGTNLEDEEAAELHLSGLVIRELAPLTSNFRSTAALSEYLERRRVLAIEGVDTRALARRIRKDGAMKGLLTTEILEPGELRRRLQEVPDLEGRDLVLEATRGRRLRWLEGYAERFWPKLATRPSEGGPPIVVLDYGAKANIFRSLVEVGCPVTVLPASATAADVMQERPRGVVLSNGPGDPRVLDYAVACVRGLLGQVPVFGICLGHQLLGAAVGAGLFKLKFGHHGGNQPVKDLDTGRVEITAQNHGFAVEQRSLERQGGRVTHLNLNDGTVEGLEIREARAFSVQYHPEASPGPRDALHLFRRFRERLDLPAGAPR